MIYDSPPDNFNPKVSVSACFVELGDRVLFVKRSQNVSQPGTWAIPGGKVEKGETPEQAIRREMLEECGFKLQNPIYLHTVYIRYPEYDYTYHMFKEIVKAAPNIVLDARDCDAYEWLTRAQADALEEQQQLILDEMPCIQRVYLDHAFGTAVPTKTICVFCSGDDKVSAQYKELAFNIGAMLAQHNCALVSGGGSNGLMGHVNAGHASIETPSLRHGVIPEVFRSYKVENPYIPEQNFVWVNTTHERLNSMYDLSDEVVVLPGGFGTMHELLDCLVHNQFGIFKKRIYLFNINNFWQPFLQQCELMLEQKTLAPHHFAYLTVVNSIPELCEHIKCHQERDIQQGFADRHWEEEQATTA